MPIFIYLEKIANIRKYRKNDEYISPIVNSVKSTVFSRFVQFSHGLEGSTAYGHINTFTKRINIIPQDQEIIYYSFKAALNLCSKNQ